MNAIIDSVQQEDPKRASPGRVGERRHTPQVRSIRCSPMVPLELYSTQELNYVVGDFFDRALYYLLRGYEAQGQLQKKAVGAGKTN